MHQIQMIKNDVITPSYWGFMGMATGSLEPRLKQGAKLASL